MPAKYDHIIPFIETVQPGRVGEQFRARRNRRNTHWYEWRECEHCQCIFPAIVSEIGRNGRGRYCSTLCSSHDNNLKGSAHPQWEGGTNAPEKLHARQAFRRAINNGEIIRQPCLICGEPNAEGHHENYDKPFEVKWLCRKHHAEHHARNRNNKGFAIV